MDESAKIQQFVALTQTEADFARSFLEAAGWDFQQAVDLYLGKTILLLASSSSEQQ